MVFYSKSTIKNGSYYGGIVIYDSNTLIYADYSDSNLYSVSATDTTLKLGFISPINSLSSVGIYDNKIYTFSADGYFYNYYTIGEILQIRAELDYITIHWQT